MPQYKIPNFMIDVRDVPAVVITSIYERMVSLAPEAAHADLDTVLYRAPAALCWYQGVVRYATNINSVPDGITPIPISEFNKIVFFMEEHQEELF